MISSTPLPTRRAALAGLAGLSLVRAARAAEAGWPLWVIEAKGTRVFLTGETPPGRTDWRDARIQALVGQVAAFWNETNHTLRGNMGELVARFGADPTAPLAARLTPLDRQRLDRAATLTGSDPAAFARFRPWLVGQLLDDAYYRKAGLTGRSAGTVLGDAAAAANKPRFSEYPASDDVLAWFGALTPAQDLQYLRYTLDHILAPPEDDQRTFADWAKGDPTRAAAWVARMKALYPEPYGAIVIERNRGWAPRIGRMLDQGQPALVVTGLYHLVGPDCVQAQLSAHGLSVRRA